tara:strand:+ start:210 stop:713 length:504 start_codon:yes stop_codon:yes gene_type:complete
MNNEQEKDIDIELEEQLVQSNYGLVVSQALSLLHKKSNIDDYIQVGLIGLLKAIRKHSSKLSKFSTFATVCIRNEILGLKKKESNKNSGEIVFDSNLLAKSTAAKYYIKESFFDYVPDCITEEEIFILKLKLESCTNREICDFLGCTKDILDKKLDSLFENIRKANQ